MGHEAPKASRGPREASLPFCGDPIGGGARLLRPLSHPQNPLDLPPESRSGINVRIPDKTGGVDVAKRKHTAEEIINKLREAEVVIAAGSTVAEAARRFGVSEQTFYR